VQTAVLDRVTGGDEDAKAGFLTGQAISLGVGSRPPEGLGDRRRRRVRRGEEKATPGVGDGR
jgi:hypothetical protein